ncbi:MAG: two-component system response regulator CreB [Sulfuricella sp.]|nr:two-component system response regulator CreB [Sulfuricella sp.]
MNQRILIVEDEPAIADAVIYALRTENFEWEHKLLGHAGLSALKAGHFDLVVLDVGLPDINGFDLCRELRTFSQVPVIFLTARDGEIDRIVGLEIGADDYVTKPFSPRELVARIRSILRRASPTEPGVGSNPAGMPFLIDVPGQRIHFYGVPLELTRYEYLMLKVLAEEPARVFSRIQLMQRVWAAPDHSLERTVDTHIKTLRAKLRAVRPEKDPIRTHRGLGYSIER